jgi:alkyldihydroxyacetonephosphate synthase
VPTPRLSHWGWGYEDAGPSEAEARRRLAPLAPIAGRKLTEIPLARPVPLAEIELRPPRFALPEAMRSLCTADAAQRVLHSYGKGFADLWRGCRGQYANPPDYVARPVDEASLRRVMEFCALRRVAAVPFGGGTSVVGGVEPPAAESSGYEGVITIDLCRFDRVLEVDPRSRSALIQAGTKGPALERQLQAHGLTLRHYPQSFEFSTLGGWIATRAGGHFATGKTHIDDFVEGLRIVSPAGVTETRHLPASGAGPSPERLFIGSEGVLGVITEAWMRVQPRPSHRARASLHFSRFEQGVEGIRRVVQAGLEPALCRLLDPGEAFAAGVSRSGSTVVLLGFESTHAPVDQLLGNALEATSGLGATIKHEAQSAASGLDPGQDGASDEWRRAFLLAPYLLNTLVRLGLIVDTIETACTWSGFESLHQAISDAVYGEMRRRCGGGLLICRFTHVYPGGPAPYYTFIAPGPKDGELEAWQAIRQAAAQAILTHGGTTTHHHSVGRLLRSYYDGERPELFAHALAAAKRVLDPQGILNPGLLVDAPAR